MIRKGPKGFGLGRRQEEGRFKASFYHGRLMVRGFEETGQRGRFKKRFQPGWVVEKLLGREGQKVGNY